jgi:hypothetical protein
MEERVRKSVASAVTLEHHVDGAASTFRISVLQRAAADAIAPGIAFGRWLLHAQGIVRFNSDQSGG